LIDHDIWVTVNVGRCETQQPISGPHEQVLALIILNQAIPMIGSVVLDNQSSLGVVKVGSSSDIEQFRLNLRRLQPGFNQ
jgi:hypothetical protein